MSPRTLPLDDRLSAYLCAVSVREPETLQHLRQVTAELPVAHMQIAPEQAQCLSFLVKLIGARQAIEIGVLTGYSALAVALALPDDGQLIACESSTEFTTIAREHWQQAGVVDKIDLRIAPALETLDDLLATGKAGQFDWVFIDADKRNYAAYYERSLALVRPGGLIAIDNTLWYGKVADPTIDDCTTQALRDFNAQLYQDQRIDLSLIPIGDGMTLARKH